jgi:hypothetical protein
MEKDSSARALIDLVLQPMIGFKSSNLESVRRALSGTGILNEQFPAYQRSLDIAVMFIL